MSAHPLQLYPSENYSDVTVIIPTLNESGTIRNLLIELIRRYPNISLLVSDDGSEDGTVSIVEALDYSSVSVIDRRPAKVKGITVSVLDAIAECRTPYFVVMDGDFQHPPSLIFEIVKRLRAKGRLVIGSRMSSASFSSRYRKLISLVATFLARCFLLFRKIDVSDPMSGCFGAETQWMKTIILANKHRYELAGYKVLFDTLKIVPSDFKVEEVGYQFAERPLGSSKFRGKHVMLLLRSLFR